MARIALRRGNLRFDGVEEADELLVPMASMADAVILAGRSTSRQPRPLGSMPSKAFFAKLTRQRLQRGVFRGSLADLKAAINRFLAEANNDPKPSSGPPIPNALSPAVKREKESLH